MQRIYSFLLTFQQFFTCGRVKILLPRSKAEDSASNVTLRATQPCLEEILINQIATIRDTNQPHTEHTALAVVVHTAMDNAPIPPKFQGPASTLMYTATSY